MPSKPIRTAPRPAWRARIANELMVASGAESTRWPLLDRLNASSVAIRDPGPQPHEAIGDRRSMALGSFATRGVRRSLRACNDLGARTLIGSRATRGGRLGVPADPW